MRSKVLLKKIENFTHGKYIRLLTIIVHTVDFSNSLQILRFFKIINPKVSTPSIKMPINESQLKQALDTHLEKVTKKLNEAVESLRKSSNETIQKILDILSQLTGTVEKHDISIKTLVEDSKSQKNTLDSVEKKLETLEIRARARNLVVHGVKEDAKETRPAIKKEIVN